jgi:hypothetical protein
MATPATEAGLKKGQGGSNAKLNADIVSPTLPNASEVGDWTFVH